MHKFAGPLAKGRVRSLKTFPFSHFPTFPFSHFPTLLFSPFSFLLFWSRAWPLQGPLPAKVWFRYVRRRLPSPIGPIFGIFWPIGEASKNHVFSTSHQNVKNQRISRARNAHDRKLLQNVNFWPPFWHRFFDFFKNFQKRVWSLQFHTFNGFDTWKTSHFLIEISYIFEVFSKPLPESVLGGHRCRPILKRAVLEPFAISGISKKAPLGHHFRQESRKRGGSSNYSSRLWLVQAAHCDFDWFLVDFW